MISGLITGKAPVMLLPFFAPASNDIDVFGRLKGTTSVLFYIMEKMNYVKFH